MMPSRRELNHTTAQSGEMNGTSDPGEEHMLPLKTKEGQIEIPGKTDNKNCI